MFRHDEQIIADFIRALYRNGIVTYEQVDEMIDILQVRLFASEYNMTVDELIDHLGLSGKAGKRKNQKPNPPQSLPQPTPQSKP